MSEEMDAILQAMQELTTTVKEHKTDPATIDMDAIKTAFQEMMADYQAAQPKPEPKRMGEVEDIGAPTRKVARVVEEGRFKGCDPLDLWIVKQHMRVAGKAPSAELLKAMDSTTGGSGDEFVPTLMAGELWQQMYLQSKVIQALGPMIPMPSNPYEIPLWSTYTWYKGTENTGTTASNPTTAKSTMTATEILAEVQWSYTLDEDSIVPMLPNLRAEMARSGAEKMDDFVLNADATAASTGNINLDDSTPNAASYYLSDGQDGIRHYFLVDDSGQGVNAGGDALTDTDLVNALVKMGKYAVDPRACLLVADAATYLKGLLNLDTVITADKFGPGATVLTGQLAAYRGLPIIVSESMPKTEADGKASNTSANNTLGQIAIVSSPMWKVGSWRSLLIEVDRDIQKRQTLMVASFRIGVGARDRTSDHSAGIYNILV